MKSLPPFIVYKLQAKALNVSKFCDGETEARGGVFAHPSMTVTSVNQLALVGPAAFPITLCLRDHQP